MATWPLIRVLYKSNCTANVEVSRRAKCTSPTTNFGVKLFPVDSVDDIGIECHF